MLGPLFQQTMKSRLGIGKPLEGYSMNTTPQWGNMQPAASASGIMPPKMLNEQWQQAQQPIAFQPRPQGGILPMEDPFNPRERPYEPRPQGGGYENPFDPRTRDYENRPRGGGMEQPQQGWGGQTSPWRKF